MELLTWLGITVSLFHCALFSGLNLGFFGSSRLRLEVQSEMKNPDAMRILSLRKDLHFLLATLLWGNVTSIVLLTLFTNSVMSGLAAFIFSTFGVTFLGEIIPQAYLAKYALRKSALLVPIIRSYQILLSPIAKPTALFLDHWLGKEDVVYFNEREVLILLHRHAQSGRTDLGLLESMGASNFLALDDIKIVDEGEVINPQSMIKLSTDSRGLPKFPKMQKSPNNKFLQKVHASGEKWVVITNLDNIPLLVLNADQFLREAVYLEDSKSIYTYCHRPIVVNKQDVKLGEILQSLKVRAERPDDDVVDNDLILFWGETQKRIVTGADILGRLLRGIVPQV